MTTGEKIQALRKARGLTQEELASQMAVTRQAVSRWELNEVLPDTGNLIQLSKIFGVSIDDLLDCHAAAEAGPPPARNVKKSAGKKSRVKWILLAAYLLAVLVYYIVTRSVLAVYAVLSFTVSLYLLYLLIRVLRKVLYGGKRN